MRSAKNYFISSTFGVKIGPVAALATLKEMSRVNLGKLLI